MQITIEKNNLNCFKHFSLSFYFLLFSPHKNRNMESSSKFIHDCLKSTEIDHLIIAFQIGAQMMFVCRFYPACFFISLLAIGLKLFLGNVGE